IVQSRNHQPPPKPHTPPEKKKKNPPQRPATVSVSRENVAQTHAGHGSQRPDCVAGHVGLELRSVRKNYPFEGSSRFPGIKPNSGHRPALEPSLGASARPRQNGRVSKEALTHDGLI